MIHLCKCGSTLSYDCCCGKYLQNDVLPDTPEQLMRSRFVAYATGNLGYIVNTMCGKPLLDFNKADMLEQAQLIKWIKLEVLDASQDADNGVVEFKAHYTYDGNQYCMHEQSQFERMNGKWYYVDGLIIEE